MYRNGVNGRVTLNISSYTISHIKILNKLGKERIFLKKVTNTTGYKIQEIHENFFVSGIS